MPKTANKINEGSPPQDLMNANGGALFAQLLSKAVDKLDGEGAESVVAVIERLVDLKMKVDKQEAEKEFNKSLAEFQQKCPPIRKVSKAEVVTKKGGKYSYKYAELDEITKTVKPHLFHRGLSFTWDSKTENANITTTCFLRHRNGHQIMSNATAPIPEELGSMNAIQIPSAVRTYLERQSLIQVLGLTTTDEDTDAAGPVNPISEEQIENLNKAIKASIPPSAVPRFLKLFKIEKLEQMKQDDYEFGLKKLAEFKKKYESDK